MTERVIAVIGYEDDPDKTQESKKNRLKYLKMACDEGHAEACEELLN